MTTRILIVDDLQGWRISIRSILECNPSFQVIGEASDGQEAVEKATALQPDLVLLDIGMPVLNGLQAAKIIRERCPKSRILFVTQDGDVDVRNEAIRVGAADYVLKVNVGIELLGAISKALGAGYPHRQRQSDSPGLQVLSVQFREP